MNETTAVGLLCAGVCVICMCVLRLMKLQEMVTGGKVSVLPDPAGPPLLRPGGGAETIDSHSHLTCCRRWEVGRWGVGDKLLTSSRSETFCHLHTPTKKKNFIN